MIMLYCYNRVKTYREIAGDIIHILYIILGLRIPDRDKKIEGIIKKVKGFEFIKIDTETGIDDIKVIEDLSPSSANLTDGLQCILNLLEIVETKNMESLVSVNFGYINYIDALIKRINEKLGLVLTGPTFFVKLTNGINIFTTNLGFLFSNENLKKIEEKIVKITDIPGFNNELISMSPVTKVNEGHGFLKKTMGTQKNKQPVNNKSQKSAPEKIDYSKMRLGSRLGLFKGNDRFKQEFRPKTA